MTKRSPGGILRRICFNICLSTLFLACLSFALLTAYGYRIDPTNITIVESGLLDLSRVSPGTTITLDGETETTKTPTQLKNLEIKKTHLSLSKKGFYPWSKDINIKRNLVTRLNEVNLIPKTSPERLFAYEKANLYAINADGKAALYNSSTSKIIIYNRSGKTLNITEAPRHQIQKIYWKNNQLYAQSPENSWTLNSTDKWQISTGSKSTLDPDPVLSPSRAKSLHTKGYEIWTKDLNKKTSQLISRYSSKPTWADWYSETQIIFSTDNQIQTCDLDGKNCVNIAIHDPNTTPTYLHSIQRLYYLDSGVLYTLNLSDQRPGLLQSFFGY